MQTTLSQTLQDCRLSHGPLLIQWISWLLHTSTTPAHHLQELFQSLQQPQVTLSFGETDPRPVQLVALYYNHPSSTPTWLTIPELADKIPFTSPFHFGSPPLQHPLTTGNPLDCHVQRAFSEYPPPAPPPPVNPLQIVFGLYFPPHQPPTQKGSKILKSKFKWVRKQELNTRQLFHIHLQPTPTPTSPFSFPAHLSPSLALSPTLNTHFPQTSSYERNKTHAILTPEQLSYICSSLPPCEQVPLPPACPPLNLFTSFISQTPATSTDSRLPLGSLKVGFSTQPLQGLGLPVNRTLPAFQIQFTYLCYSSEDVPSAIKQALRTFLIALHQLTLIVQELGQTAQLEEDLRPLTKNGTLALRNTQTNALHNINLCWNKDHFTYSNPLEPFDLNVPLSTAPIPTHLPLSDPNPLLYPTIRPLLNTLYQVLHQDTLQALSC